MTAAAGVAATATTTAARIGSARGEQQHGDSD
jgi:hypothetical protein